MIIVSGLIWDDWNKKHLVKHQVSIKEVEEVCHGRHQAVETYRRRIQLSGETIRGRKLVVILSPEDRDLRQYDEGIYYPITAFEEVK